MTCHPGARCGGTSVTGGMTAPGNVWSQPCGPGFESLRVERLCPAQPSSTASRWRPRKKGAQRLRRWQKGNRTQAAHRGGHHGVAAGHSQAQAGQPPLQSLAQAVGGRAPPGLAVSMPPIEQGLSGTHREQRGRGAYRHGQPDSQTPPTHLSPFATLPLRDSPASRNVLTCGYAFPLG